MKKKALTYTLAVAMLLSLAACHKPQTDQPDTSQPEPTTADVSTPEPMTTPEPDTAQGPERLASKTQEKQELSGQDLIDCFQFVYDAAHKQRLSGEEEEAISYELEILRIRAEDVLQVTLPSDYKEQYKAWRPVDETPADTQTPAQSDSSKGQSQAQGNTQQSGNESDTQTTRPTDESKNNDQKFDSGEIGDFDPYDGYGSYEAYIDAIAAKKPQYTREELKQRYPDKATLHYDADRAAADASEGRMNWD